MEKTLLTFTRLQVITEREAYASGRKPKGVKDDYISIIDNWLNQSCHYCNKPWFTLYNTNDNIKLMTCRKRLCKTMALLLFADQNIIKYKTPKYNK